MLLSLHIKNVALIDNVQINFDKGLNVLSGETGSGKSIILDSLNFVLGARADKSFIRTGENECLVKATFDVSDNLNLKAVFDECDIEYEDTLIISRKFSLDGKSQIKINGNTVTVGMLRKFTSYLVDVHGQSEHFSLLKKENQLNLIDNFFNDKIFKIKDELREKITEYKNIIKELDSLGGDSSSRAIRLDILNYQINEITTFDLKEGEEEDLLLQKERILNGEKICNALSALSQGVSGDGASCDILSICSKQLALINDISEDFSSLSDRLNNVLSELEDIGATALDYLEQNSNFDLDVDKIEARLDGIKLLKRKYGSTLDEINDYLANSIKEKELIENFEENAEKFLKQKALLEDNIYILYNELSAERKVTANNLCELVLSELIELGISKPQFYVDFANIPSKEDCTYTSTNGVDQIEFMFSANLGEPAKSLAEVISGGEMSRLMLAIKTQTSKINNVSTFVFDEIDSGISGAVAKIVAEKFAKIAMNTQIIAISHLAQISAMADENLYIYKVEESDKTLTKIEKLSCDNKIKEIVRLIGGDINNDIAVSHAKELIENASNYKKTL